MSKNPLRRFERDRGGGGGGLGGGRELKRKETDVRPGDRYMQSGTGPCCEALSVGYRD